MKPEELEAWLRLTHTRGIGRDVARRLLAAFGLPQEIFGADDAALRQVVGAAQLEKLRTLPEDFKSVCERARRWLGDTPAGAGERALVTLGDIRYPPRLLEIEDPPVALYMLGQLPPWRDVARASANGNSQQNKVLALDPLAQPAPSLVANSDVPCIAIVGTRNPTPQGAQNAHAFAAHFASAGWCVVSGLALGIDAEAHRGALSGGARPGASAGPLPPDDESGADDARHAGPHTPATIAVVGTGLDQVYPRRNQALAGRIAAGGLLISEYPLGTPPLAMNFPRRNRLISGLALGTLVVEATQPSGSLITARMALEQGREVFAIPGSIHSPQSRGCHALIRQGAKLVECAEDVLEELPLHGALTNTMNSVAGGEGRANATAPKDARSFASSNAEKAAAVRTVWTVRTDAADAADAADTPGAGSSASDAAATGEHSLLAAIGFDPVGLDALIARTGIDAARLQGQLLELELDGEVARLPGGLFQRVGVA